MTNDYRDDTADGASHRLAAAEPVNIEGAPAGAPWGRAGAGHPHDPTAPVGSDRVVDPATAPASPDVTERAAFAGSEWADPRSVPMPDQQRYDPAEPTRPTPAPWPPPPNTPGAPWPAQGPPAPQAARGGLARTLVIGLVAGLLGGLLGGVVSYSLASGGGSIGVLGVPLPGIDDTAPLGPVEAVAQRVLPSVVQLRVAAGDVRGEGSGIVLSADGLMLTNNHVVDQAAGGGTVTAVFSDGATAAVEIVGRDPSSDIAIIRARGVSGLTPIELGNSDAVRVGQQVVAVGSPLGLGGSVTTGIISAVDRAVNVGPQQGATDATILNALQTDAAINPGNSGGPLVDMRGRVIGINSAIATTGGAEGGSIGVGFSIPINQAQRIGAELERTGVATRAVLGVNVTGGGDESTGAVIGQVTPGGPAEKAGLVTGEVITRVDDRVISGGDELVAAIRDHAPEDQVTLVVNGREVVVTLGSKTG